MRAWKALSVGGLSLALMLAGACAEGPRDDGPEDARGPTRAGGEIRPLDAPVAVPLKVLAVRFNNPSVAIIDLERGEIASYPRGEHGLPRDAIGGAMVMADGTVVVWQDGTLRAFTEGMGNPPLVHTPAELINPPGYAPSLRALPTTDERAIWVVQIGGFDRDVAGRAELVQLATGSIELTAELPAHSFPVATTTDGLLLNTVRYVDTGDGWVDEPGSHATLLLREDGILTELSAGVALAASNDTAAVLTCEEHASARNCELDLVDVDTGERRRVQAPVDGTWTGVTGPDVPGDVAPWSATAPDGRILAGLGVRDGLKSKPSESYLVAINPDDGSVTVLQHLNGPLRPAAWDQHAGTVVLADGSHLIVLDLADGSSFIMRDVIPTGHFVVGMR